MADEDTKSVAPSPAGQRTASPQTSAQWLREGIIAASPAVRRYLFTACGDWHEAEDLTQEAMLRAWARRASFDGRSEVRTWVFAIARNYWLDCLRKRRAAPAQETMDEQRMTSSAASPDAAASRGELTEAIRSAVAHLPAEQREALSLRESGGLTFLQIGQVLGVPPATVKSRVRYALLKLADQLRPFERELEP